MIKKIIKKIKKVATKQPKTVKDVASLSGADAAKLGIDPGIVRSAKNAVDPKKK